MQEQWPADNITRRKVKELWKPIFGFSNYEVSNLGRVRSTDHTTRDGRSIKGRVLKAYTMPSGYMQVSLGERKKRYVHRLVCAAWNGPPAAGLEVGHSDGKKDNNIASNLAWVTHAENEQQKKAHGTYARPRVFWQPHHKKRGPKPTLHPQHHKIICMRKSGASIRDVAAFLGMSKSGAYDVIKNRCFDAAI